MDKLKSMKQKTNNKKKSRKLHTQWNSVIRKTNSMRC